MYNWYIKNKEEIEKKMHCRGNKNTRWQWIARRMKIGIFEMKRIILAREDVPIADEVNDVEISMFFLLRD